MPESAKTISPEACLALLKGRRSIRRYRAEPVPEEMVHQLLEAGRWAPSASNRQPWHIIVIRDEAIRQQVAEHAAAYVIRWAQVGEAPLLLALCGDGRNPIYRQFLHEDVGLAGAQIMLQAHALGLGTCWIGGLDRKALGGILRLPGHVDVVGLLTVGFPAESPPPRSRKPLGEIVHYDVFGNQVPVGEVTAGSPAGGWLLNQLRRARFTIRPGSTLRRPRRRGRE
jgi:nitroreductase